MKPTPNEKTTERPEPKGEKITGEFYAVKPLDEYSICVGLTTLPGLPVFLAQVKAAEDGTWVFGAKIALTPKETSAVLQFFDAMRDQSNGQ